MNHEFQSTPDYLRLCKGGTYFRMLRLRDRALQTSSDVHLRTLAPSLQKQTWREARSWGFHNWEKAHGTLDQGKQKDGSPIWYTHTGEYFRNELDAHDIVRSLPRGWFTDTDCSETAIGIVAALPHGRFLAGYRWTSNGERVYFPEVFTDAEDAASAADTYAEDF